MTERLCLVPAVYGLLRRDDEVFFIRRFNTGFWDGYYSLPAGHVENGESIQDAAAREIGEESGVVVVKSDLELVHVIHRVADEGDHQRCDYFFATTKWSGEPRNCEPNKCDDARWCPNDALPQPTAPLIQYAIEKILAGEIYSDLDFVSSRQVSV